MTIDFLHLYCKCPHCTTMFRAAVSDVDASEGWAKCGHCRKVFDCRKNEIKPIDFISLDETKDNDSESQAPQEQAEDTNEASTDDEFVPQISLFDESGQEEKSNPEITAVPDKPQAADTDKTDRSVRRLLEDADSRLSSTAQSEKQVLPKTLKATQAGSPHKLDDGPIRTTVAAQSGHLSNRPKSVGINTKVKVSPEPEKKVSKKPQSPSHSNLKSRLNITKPKAPGFSAILLAKAQSWKKQKNRFKKTSAFPGALIAIALVGLLIWQIAVVNYTKLIDYKFLSGPLAAVCSMVTCNEAAAPLASGFEILHASVRRHASIPNVMTVSAKLINFSDENQLMPTLRLDLTNDDNSIIASSTIDLPENPQYIEPALTELAPGQDVQLVFNIDNPNPSAHGFQLSLVSE